MELTTICLTLAHFTGTTVNNQCYGAGSWIRDPGSGAFLTPGSWIRIQDGKNPDLGSGMNTSDLIFENFNSLMRIRDPGSEVSRIRNTVNNHIFCSLFKYAYYACPKPTDMEIIPCQFCISEFSEGLQFCHVTQYIRDYNFLRCFARNEKSSSFCSASLQ
jgi:hypothetical protein